MKLLQIQKSTVRVPHPERKNNFRLRAQMSASVWPTSLSTLIKSRTLVWSVSFFSWRSHSPFTVVFCCCNICKISSHSVTKCTNSTASVVSSGRLSRGRRKKNLDFERNCCEKKKKQFLFRFFFGSKSFLFRRFPFVFGRSSFRPEFFLPPLSRFWLLLLISTEKKLG